MHPFGLSSVTDPAVAIAIHAEDPDLAFIAGGTDLIGLMKDRAARPERLLDINGLPDMARIDALADGALRIGALARMSDVAAHVDVQRRFPLIAESLLFAASGQLRNMASIGGNINPKTARSQAIGGIIWGVGQALLEQSETDPVLGRFLNRNCSGYLVPTNADISRLETLFVGEFDEEAGPLGTKGLGELTAVSVAPAIANAVYHATGKRVRDLPITVEKLL